MPAVDLWVQGCANISRVKQADNAQAGMPPDAGLSADESIVQLHVEKAELHCATGTNFATFVELDFFQHATQATPIMQGPRFVLMRPVSCYKTSACMHPHNSDCTYDPVTFRFCSASFTKFSASKCYLKL